MPENNTTYATPEERKREAYNMMLTRRSIFMNVTHLQRLENESTFTKEDFDVTMEVINDLAENVSHYKELLQNWATRCFCAEKDTPRD